jgi:hypothetical protein
MHGFEGAARVREVNIDITTPPNNKNTHRPQPQN